MNLNSVNKTRKTNQPIPIFNANLNVEPLFYTIKQAAIIMGFDQGTLRNWISLSEKNAGKHCPFETTKKGGKRLILISSFNDYLARRDEGVSSSAEIQSHENPRGRGRPRNTYKEQVQLANQN